MSAYILTIDIGNTSTSFGLFKHTLTSRFPHPRQVWRVSTAQLNTQLTRALHSQLQRGRISFKQIVGVMISSVVPSVDKMVAKKIKAVVSSPVRFVTSHTQSPVKNRYARPTEVGADRLVNARAVMALTKKSCIVVDFGTATTFDCVTKKGEYLGGVIAPGPAIAAEALFRRTAKLPQVYLDRPTKPIGTSTKSSIRSGLYFGYRGLVKEILTQLKKKLGSQTMVYATGGQGLWILKGLQEISAFYPNLTLQGLSLLWHDQY